MNQGKLVKMPIRPVWTTEREKGKGEQRGKKKAGVVILRTDMNITRRVSEVREIGMEERIVMIGMEIGMIGEDNEFNSHLSEIDFIPGKISITINLLATSISKSLLSNIMSMFLTTKRNKRWNFTENISQNLGLLSDMTLHQFTFGDKFKQNSLSITQKNSN